MVADAARGLRFCDGLLRRTGEASDHRQWALGPVGRRLCGQFQHWPVQADIADRELCRVHADCKAAGAGVEIIARQRALMPGIERAVGVERQRMRRKTVPSAISFRTSDLISL